MHIIQQACRIYTIGQIRTERNALRQQQNEVKQILSDEISRLKAKKDNMDVENHNRDRMILLNQSYRDKQREYLLIMVIFLLLFGIKLLVTLSFTLRF